MGAPGEFGHWGLNRQHRQIFSHYSVHRRPPGWMFHLAPLLKLSPITSHPAPECENILSPCHATCPDVVDQVGSWSLTGPLLHRWFIKTFGGDWRPLRICVCTNLSLSGLPTHGRIHVNFPWSPQQLTKSLIFVHTRRVLFSCITCIPNSLWNYGIHSTQ